MTSGEPLAESQVQGVLRWLHTIINAVTLGAATIIIGTDVVLRYVFNAPLEWSIEATGLLLLMMVFASLPYVWERRGHIRMELLSKHFSGASSVAADLATAVSGAIFSVLLCYEMIRNAPMMRAMNEGAEHLGVPHWPFAIFIAFIAALMTLQFGIFAVRAVLGLRR